MSKKNHTQNDQDRSYSPFYEKGIPIAIYTIVAIIALMLLLTIGIALGLIQAG